jgi:hypothetical protein
MQVLLRRGEPRHESWQTEVRAAKEAALMVKFGFGLKE